MLARSLFGEAITVHQLCWVILSLLRLELYERLLRRSRGTGQ
ncbi:MAG: hypothetical protein ACK5HK_03600 [Pseudanabaena sp.]